MGAVPACPRIVFCTAVGSWSNGTSPCLRPRKRPSKFSTAVVILPLVVVGSVEPLLSVAGGGLSGRPIIGLGWLACCASPAQEAPVNPVTTKVIERKFVFIGSRN